MNRLLTLAAVAMTLAACNSEIDDLNVEIRLKSGLDVQQTDTRAATTIQSDKFDKDAAIDVYISEATKEGQEETTITKYTQPLTYTIGEDGSTMNGTQQYFPTSGNGVNIYAVYPSGTSIASENTFTIKVDQSMDADYKASDLMYGKPTTNPVERQKSAVSINFKHLLSKVTVKLESGKGTPSLDGAVVKLKGVKPSTTLTASITEGKVSEACGDAKAITVMTAATDALSGSAVIVPQTLSTSFIEVTLKNGGVLTSTGLSNGSTSLESVVLETGKAYTYTITVNLTGLSVSSSITDWGDGSSVTGDAEMSTSN